MPSNRIGSVPLRSRGSDLLIATLWWPVYLAVSAALAWAGSLGFNAVGPSGPGRALMFVAVAVVGALGYVLWVVTVVRLAGLGRAVELETAVGDTSG